MDALQYRQYVIEQLRQTYRQLERARTAHEKKLNHTEADLQAMLVGAV